jgi:hypothetical protein
MLVFRDTLEAVTWADIDQLCADQVSEGTEFELKSDLPTKDGGLHPWHSGGQVGDYARNQIAEQIIAFANTLALGSKVLLQRAKVRRAVRPRHDHFAVQNGRVGLQT